MLDVKSRIIESESNKLFGYRLTDRKEDIIVNLEQFEKLVNNGLIYSVVHSYKPNRIIGINGLNLENIDTEQYVKDTSTPEKVKIKYRVVRYRESKVLEMFNYEHLDYIQKRYFTNEIVKLENKQILQSIQALEKLTNMYSDETCTDIQPFIDRYRNKFEVLGYYVENISKETLLIRENSKVKYKKLPPGGRTYINIKEMQLLCKKYNLNKSNMTTRVEEMLLSIEHTTSNKYIETLSKSIRRQLVKDKKYKSYKDTIAKQVLREEDYTTYKQTGGCW